LRECTCGGSPVCEWIKRCHGNRVRQGIQEKCKNTELV